MLHYANATCAPAVADMDPLTRITLQTNVACVAAEAFINRKKSDETTDVLVKAVAPFFDEIRQHLGGAELPAPGGDELAWITFDAVASAGGRERLLPKVIQYDEGVGAPVTEQDTRVDTARGGQTAVAVPWKAWLQSSAAQELDEQSGNVAAVTMVLRSLHHNGKVADQDVEVTLDMDSKQRIAKASADLEAGSLELPPCVPASGRVHATSTHPQRVAVTVTNKDVVAKKMLGKQSAGAAHALASRSATFYVHPEYKVPIDKTPVSAVADGLSPQTRVWEWSGDESLHPFWAIQRLSKDELNKKNKQDKTTHRFNVSLKEKQYNVVTVGNLRDESVSVTVTVTLPVLTNETALVAGEELFLEVVPKDVAKKKRPDTSWKDDVASASRAQAKAKVAAPKAKAAPSMVVDSEV